MTSGVYGNASQIQYVIREFDQAGNQIYQLSSQLRSYYSRLAELQSELGRVWSSTRWSGPERSSAESAYRAAVAYLGQARGGMGQAANYARYASSPLASAESALRRFLSRLTA